MENEITRDQAHEAIMRHIAGGRGVGIVSSDLSSFNELNQEISKMYQSTRGNRISQDDRIIEESLKKYLLSKISGQIKELSEIKQNQEYTIN